MGGRSGTVTVVVVLVVVLVAALAVVFLSVGKKGEQSPQPLTQTAPTVGAVISKPQAMCPIMNQPINKELYVDVEGKRIYVCCESCIDTIKQAPVKYIKQMESQGVVLEKAPGETK
jgi:ABC-type anion transport system duplicated permease subunit